MTNARRGDLYEIEAARIAEQRTRSPEVRQLAQRMTDGNAASSNRLMEALRPAQDSDLMDELNPHRQSMLDHLSEASDSDFDSRYLSQQKLAHHETLTLFESFESSGDNAQLVAYACNMLPVLHQNKELVERIEGSDSLRS